MIPFVRNEVSPRRSRSALIAPLVAAGAAGLACGGGGGAAAGADACSTSLPQAQSAPPAGSPYLAFAQDFHGYHDWPSYDVTEDADLVGIHDGSIVIEYINRLPASDAVEFPIGTLIVKEATGGTLPHEIFAMAKRGGGFNSVAVGWEWFELENLDCPDDRVKLVWRGVGPPIGETYGGDPNGGCNTCHDDCGNDAVCAKALSLSLF
jgi:hypothetical protein